MIRTYVAWILVALIVPAFGCRMCASTWDDCGPVVDGSCGPECNSDARVGSILSGTVQPAAYPEDYEQYPSQEFQSGEIPYDEEISSGVILSVTDRKVEDVNDPRLAGSSAGSQGWSAANPAGGMLQ